MAFPKSFCCKKSWSLYTGSKIISTTYMICTTALLSGLIFMAVDEVTFRSLSKLQLSDYFRIGKSLFPQTAYIDSNILELNNYAHSSAIAEKMIARNSDPVGGTDETLTTIGGRKIGKKNTTTRKMRKGKAVGLFTTNQPEWRRRRRYAARHSAKTKHDNHKDIPDLFTVIFVYTLTLHGFYFVACIFLMIGVLKRSWGFVVQWLKVDFFRQLVVLASWVVLCYYTVDILKKDPDVAKFAIPFFAAILIVIVLTFYFWLVICSFYKELYAKRHAVIPEEKDDGTIDSST